ncbi:MAG: hypothetical protein KDD70_00145 [Bdellovibrionales bacterium]|nr:hypothetical protein [Bdellovibrionales bacterium]
MKWQLSLLVLSVLCLTTTAALAQNKKHSEFDQIRLDAPVPPSVTGAMQKLIASSAATVYPAAYSQSLRSSSFSAACQQRTNSQIEISSYSGESLMGGGTLQLTGYDSPRPTLGGLFEVQPASFLGIASSHGLLVGDRSNAFPAVRGCGGIGGSGVPGNGCGDPSPVGGRFSGLFGTSLHAVDTNDQGDTVFLSDIDQGSTTRGLFLFDISTMTTRTIASLGMSSPIGSIVELSGGTINSSGDVVFLANSQNSEAVLHWSKQSGLITKIVALGDTLPTGTVTWITQNLFRHPDQSFTIAGPRPAINDRGTVAFVAEVNNNQWGYYVYRGGQFTVYALEGDILPSGATLLYNGFGESVILNNQDHLGFSAGEFFSSTNQLSRWFFVTAPRIYIPRLGHRDQLFGERVTSIAISRGPHQAIDDCGNSVFWTETDNGVQLTESIILIDVHGVVHRIAQTGQPTPLGGTFSILDASPSFAKSGRQGAFRFSQAGGLSSSVIAKFSY